MKRLCTSWEILKNACGWSCNEKAQNGCACVIWASVPAVVCTYMQQNGCAWSCNEKAQYGYAFVIQVLFMQLAVHTCRKMGVHEVVTKTPHMDSKWLRKPLSEREYGFDSILFRFENSWLQFYQVLGLLSKTSMLRKLSPFAWIYVQPPISILKFWNLKFWNFDILSFAVAIFSELKIDHSMRFYPWVNPWMQIVTEIERLYALQIRVLRNRSVLQSGAFQYITLQIQKFITPVLSGSPTPFEDQYA